ncbi:MAG: glycerophosphodiester phosphodiesterase [Rhodospirillales bacterium]|nr:glycerophosphodiester phosphodiesterase [Rhodospirillales bacterium]
MSLPFLPRIIGHRGAKASAPENTLASIRQAKTEGAGWVEFDVKLTADGEAVLIHDETLDRTTDGCGKVRERTLADIRALDAGGWFSPRFAGERVPTLAEALALMAELGLGFNLEIKPCPGREAETARVAVAAIARYWPASLPAPIVSSFQIEALRAARDAAPHVMRGYIVEKLSANWRTEAESLGCRSIHPSWRGLDEATARAIKTAGLALLVWTVNKPDVARRLLDWGADSLITDAPAALAGELATK